MTRGDKSMSSTTKNKLRTVADVISRLRWSSEQDNDIVLGYDDRVHGPMEKLLDDYKPIKDGGDIPEHRICYVRTALVDATDPRKMEQSVLWDRLGRVDRLFASGNGENAPVSPMTLQHVSEAIENMARLDVEKQERRARKEKQRAMKTRKRAAKMAAINYLSSHHQEDSPSTQRGLRYSWVPTPWFTFSQKHSAWREGVRGEGIEPPHIERASTDKRGLKVVTWNVLFDLYDNELGDAEERWTLIGSLLSKTNPDIITLQEATPSFVSILLSQSWVKDHYASTAIPSNTETVAPSGNMCLWRKSVFVPSELGVFVCVDSFRRCTILAVLERVGVANSPFLTLANVHLLANKEGEAHGSGSRAVARRRELASVIGQLQNLEAQAMRAGKTSVPMIVGDLNTSDQDTDLTDGSFSGYCTARGHEGVFVDIWPMLEQNQPGYTFDPTTNGRALRTRTLTTSTGGPKRLDRMYVAKKAVEPTTENRALMKPLEATLLGTKDTLRDETPPSDHYGLVVSFEIADVNKLVPCLRYPGLNGWAANANPTTNTLLALVLDGTQDCGFDLFNSTSTLPVPHITLLHGFVELSSSGFRDYAIQDVREAIDTVRETRTEWELRFDEKSLDVFEHRGSATLIARPDMTHTSMMWLARLYKALTTTFQQCYEQEGHSSEGWVPHLSLETFGTSFAARAEASSRVETGRWFQGEKLIPVHGVTIFERNTADGKFYAVASIPFERGNRHNPAVETVLHDACASWSSCFDGTCSGVLWEIQRACQAVAGDNIKTTLSVYGSYAMDAALPLFSDIDAVVKVRNIDGSTGAMQFESNDAQLLADIATRIKSRYETSKCRVRTAAVVGGATLPILTVKLWSSAPSVDLLLCRTGSNGRPLAEQSEVAMRAVDDTVALLDTLRNSFPDEIDVVSIFAGALRIIKLWAYRRFVYGGSTGFLGGGAWAVLLARTMLKGSQNGSLGISDASSPTLFCVVKDFFCTAAHLSLPLSITLTSESADASVTAPLTIWPPSQEGNLGRSTTMATSLAILDELKRAAALLSSSDGADVEKHLVEVLRSPPLEEFISTFQSLLMIDVPKPQDKTDFIIADAKAWSCRQLLHLTVELQHVLGDASLIRPRPLPIRHANAATGVSFVWLIGLQASSTRELLEFVEEKSSSIQQDWANTFPSSIDNVPTVQFLNTQDALNSIGV